MRHPRGFASDNYAGAHPDVLAALARVNADHVPGYGDDPHTERLRERMREVFGAHARTYPVFNGTGGNVLALSAVLQRWEAVICTEAAHIAVDEAGAPERIAGTKLMVVDAPDAKLSPELAQTRYGRVGDVHAVQPRVLSLTQSTELGTVYGREELDALVAWARERDVLVHVDGARIANAAAARGEGLADVVAGADLLTFGGTKGGLLGAEAVVVLNPDLGAGIENLRKGSMQLASKMRFLSAQLEAYLTDDLWRRNAEHANAMARKLADAVGDAPGVTVTQAVQANAVFAALPPMATVELQERWAFYVWDEATGVVRWMCSWDTTEEDVEAFAADVAVTAAKHGA